MNKGKLTNESKNEIEPSFLSVNLKNLDQVVKNDDFVVGGAEEDDVYGMTKRCVGGSNAQAQNTDSAQY